MLHKIHKLKKLYSNNTNILDFLREEKQTNRVEDILISYDLQSGTYYFNEETLTKAFGYNIIRKHGIKPDSNAARQLGYRELTEQPDYPVAGYELQADGKYEPIRSYDADIARLTAELAAAQATIDTYENP